MPKLLRIGLAVLAILWVATLPARAEMSAEQKREIERLVRDYLIANPEVIEQAIETLQKKRQQEATVAQAKVIDSGRQLIFDSTNQMVLGNPQGKITLVEFFDYNCGYCKRAMTDMQALMTANPDLRIVMKEFPILSEASLEAARISVAVKDTAPESYWKFHQELFSRPGQASGDKALEVARDLGLDVAALKAAAGREGVMRNLQEVQDLANKLGISGTPSYVIGHELVPGAAGYDVLQEKVAAMRECGATLC